MWYFAWDKCAFETDKKRVLRSVLNNYQIQSWQCHTCYLFVHVEAFGEKNQSQCQLIIWTPQPMRTLLPIFISLSNADGWNRDYSVQIQRHFKPVLHFCESFSGPQNVGYYRDNSFSRNSAVEKELILFLLTCVVPVTVKQHVNLPLLSKTNNFCKGILPSNGEQFLEVTTVDFDTVPMII